MGKVVALKQILYCISVLYQNGYLSDSEKNDLTEKAELYLKSGTESPVKDGLSKFLFWDDSMDEAIVKALNMLDSNN